MYAPFVRIALRYGAGAVLGQQAGATLAGDADLVSVGTVAIAALVGAVSEYWHYHARKSGGAT